MPFFERKLTSQTGHALIELELVEFEHRSYYVFWRNSYEVRWAIYTNLHRPKLKIKNQWETAKNSDLLVMYGDQMKSCVAISVVAVEVCSLGLQQSDALFLTQTHSEAKRVLTPASKPANIRFMKLTIYWLKISRPTYFVFSVPSNVLSDLLFHPVRRQQ